MYSLLWNFIFIRKRIDKKEKKIVNKTNWLNSKWCFKIDVTAYLLWCLMAAFDISYDDKKTKETIQAHDIMHSKQTKNVPKHQNSSPCMLRRQLVPASLSIAHKNAICYSSFFVLLWFSFYSFLFVLRVSATLLLSIWPSKQEKKWTFAYIYKFNGWNVPFENNRKKKAGFLLISLYKHRINYSFD